MQRGGRKRADYSKDLALIGTSGLWMVLGIGLVLLVILPLVLNWTHNDIWISFLVFTAITIIGVLGLNVITGMTGLISMGHSGLMLVGAYGMAMLGTEAHWPFWAALIPSILISGGIGIIVALPVIRLKGFYVVIATLAFFYIAQYIIRVVPAMQGLLGIIGIPYPVIGSFQINNDLRWYYFVLVLAILSILASANISRSRLGRAFLTTRDNDIAASSLGINVPIIKLQSFFIGSLFAGLAGALWASYVSMIRMDSFTIWDSIWFLAMIFIGGAGSTAGAVIGVLTLRMVSQVLHVLSTSGIIPLGSDMTAYLTYSVYGLIIILFISLKPFGLISLWQKLKINYKRWPFGV